MNPARPGPTSSRTDAARILEERARHLARPAVFDAGTAGGVLEVVRFRLRGLPHAVETRYVREMVHPGPLTPVPGATSLLVGVTNLRGAVLPIFDLAALLGLSALREPAERPLALVLGGAVPDLAVLVDDALDVVSLPVAALGPPPGGAVRGPGSLVRGVAADHTIILDGAALMAEPRFDQGGGGDGCSAPANTRRDA